MQNNQVFDILTVKVTVSHMECRKVQPRIDMVQHGPLSMALAGATLVPRAWLGNSHVASLAKPGNGCSGSLGNGVENCCLPTSLMLAVGCVPMYGLALPHGLVCLRATFAHVQHQSAQTFAHVQHQSAQTAALGFAPRSDMHPVGC